MADPNVISQLLGGGGSGSGGSNAPSFEGGAKGADSLADLAESLGAQASKLTTLQTLAKQSGTMLPGAAHGLQQMAQSLQQVTQQAAAAGAAVQKTTLAMQTAAKTVLAASPAATGTTGGSVAGIAKKVSDDLKLQMRSQSAVPNIDLKLQSDSTPNIDLKMADKDQGKDLPLELEKNKKKRKSTNNAASAAKVAAKAVAGGDDDDGGKDKKKSKADSPAAPSGVMHVIIDGPFPLRVIDESGRRQAGTPQERARHEMAGKGGGGSGFGSAAGAMAAGAGAIGVMSGLAGAASPALFNTLAGSIKILSGEIGNVLAPAALAASAAIQKIAYHIRTMDADTKAAIGEKLKFAGAVIGVTFALSKIVPALEMAAGGVKLLGAAMAGLGLPALGIGLAAAAVGAVVFKDELAKMLPPGLSDQVSALADTVRETLGTVWQMVGPDMVKVGEAATHLGDVVFPILRDAATSLGKTIVSLSPMLGNALVLALQAAAEGIERFSKGIAAINEVMGGSLPKVLAVAAGAVLTLRAAILALNYAASASPLKVFAVAVTALVIAIGSLEGAGGGAAAAVKKVTDELAQQLATVERLEPALERIRGGGNVQSRDVKAAFDVNEEAALRGASSPEEQKKLLTGIRNEARRDAGGSLQEIELEEAEHAKGLVGKREMRTDPATGKLREGSFTVTEEEAREYARKKFAGRKAAAIKAEVADRAIEQEGGIDFSGKRSTPGKAAAEKAGETLEAVMAKAAEELAKVMAKYGPSSVPEKKTKDGKEMPDFEPVRAVTHSLSPTMGSMTQIRNQLLQANVGKDAIERQQLEIQKRTDTNIENIWKTIVASFKQAAPGNIDKPNPK